MIRAFLHVIFLNRVKPYTGDSEVCYVIQMILYSFQIAAMTCERLITVYISFQHSGNDVVGRVAIGETVRHNEIKHVARIKTFYCRSIRPALFKLVRDFCLLFALLSAERLTSADDMRSPYNSICNSGFFIPAHQKVGATFFIVLAANTWWRPGNNNSKIMNNKFLFMVTRFLKFVRGNRWCKCRWIGYAVWQLERKYKCLFWIGCW